MTQAGEELNELEQHRERLEYEKRLSHQRSDKEEELELAREEAKLERLMDETDLTSQVEPFVVDTDGNILEDKDVPIPDGLQERYDKGNYDNIKTKVVKDKTGQESTLYYEDGTMEPNLDDFPDDFEEPDLVPEYDETNSDL